MIVVLARTPEKEECIREVIVVLGGTPERELIREATVVAAGTLAKECTRERRVSVLVEVAVLAVTVSRGVPQQGTTRTDACLLLLLAQ